MVGPWIPLSHHSPGVQQAINEATVASFSFAAAGDYGDYWASSGTTSQVVSAIANSGANFAVAIGDLAYTSNPSTASAWCQNFKSLFNNVVVVSGNHDSGESDYGPMDVYNQSCPFSALGVPMISGTILDDHGTSYGYEYAFDYPALNPIARFILVSPEVSWSCCGLSGTYSYNAGTLNHAWVSSRIDEAKAAGEWVIVGWHKTHWEVSTDLWTLMFEKKVDLVLVGHDHVYERTYQLKCGDDDIGCISNTSVDTYVKGGGVEYVVQGTGGEGLGIATPELVIPPSRLNDTNHGFTKYTVSATSLTGEFVPVDGSFTDKFTISSSAQPPPSDQGGCPWCQFTLTSPTSLWLLLVAGLTFMAILTAVVMRRRNRSRGKAGKISALRCLAIDWAGILDG